MKNLDFNTEYNIMYYEALKIACIGQSQIWEAFIETVPEFVAVLNTASLLKKLQKQI